MELLEEAPPVGDGHIDIQENNVGKALTTFHSISKESKRLLPVVKLQDLVRQVSGLQRPGSCKLVYAIIINHSNYRFSGQVQGGGAKVPVLIERAQKDSLWEDKISAN